jgi:hypothetical protein
MAITADLAFGTEPVTVGDTTRNLDICGLADELYDACQSVPEDTPLIKMAPLEAGLVNEVLIRKGLPVIASAAAACKLAEEVFFRAAELKKLAGSVWRSADALALPNDSPDSTSSD